MGVVFMHCAGAMRPVMTFRSPPEEPVDYPAKTVDAEHANPIADAPPMATA